MLVGERERQNGERKRAKAMQMNVVPGIEWQIQWANNLQPQTPAHAATVAAKQVILGSIWFGW